MLSVLLNSELTGRLGFLATCPKAIMVFVCGHEEGHKSRGSESSPCSLGCWGTKPSPSPCSSSLSDHRFWKKKPGSYRDHGPNKASSQLWQHTVQCSCCFISSHGGRPKVTPRNARDQEHRHNEFCTVWGHVDIWNLSFLDDTQLSEDFNEEHQISSCGIKAFHGQHC